jgi:hypothetical protein
MKKLVLIGSILIFSLFSASSQGIKWASTKNWRLYEIKDKQYYALPVDSLTRFKTLAISSDTIHDFLKLAEQWPKEKYSMWMGRYLCSYELDGIARKIYISVYGGFFFDEVSTTYYQVPEALEDEWQKYWIDTYLRFIK